MRLHWLAWWGERPISQQRIRTDGACGADLGMIDAFDAFSALPSARDLFSFHLRDEVISAEFGL